MAKRLFIFAAFDPQDAVGPASLYYINALCELGDVVFSADNPCDTSSLPVLHAIASHHGEYDFGSYKRGFNWAIPKLGQYDFVYFVNDSVFGPLSPLKPVLEKMENDGLQASALAYNPHHKRPHLETWFFGLRQEVFGSDWFEAFMLGVKPQQSKEDVCEVYENGLTRQFIEHGVSHGGYMTVKGRGVYNSVDKLYRQGLPFIKRAAFTRHGGSLGGQIKRVLDSVPGECREAILQDSKRLYGEDYTKRLLSANPAVLAGRYIKYLFGKL